jgi:RimJ/RimL family protein N-acetyltransferase
MAFCAPITLSGTYVSLEPLAREHHDELLAAATDGELWNLWYTSVPEPGDFAAEIDRILAMETNGSRIAFSIRCRETGKLCGSTSYLNIDAVNHRLEIGGTWIAKSHQRSPVNTESKLLLMSRAFEALGCIAVEFRTHWMNEQSRCAILRLGAKQDGVLRNHQRAKNGTLRDTVVFSVIQSEWPAVKANLEHRLCR